MKAKMESLGLALACALLCASTLMAQGPGGAGGTGGQPGGEGQRPPRPLIDTALDASGDGMIDASEMAGAPTALKQLDKSGDGQLTPDECRAPRSDGHGGSGAGRPLPPIVSALDANGDGVIEASEMADAPSSLIKLDKNGDGQLSPDEYRPPRPDDQGRAQGPAGEARQKSRNAEK